MARVGVFICKCGKNIGGKVDCQKVSEYFETKRFVEHSTYNDFTCSDIGQNSIKEAIKTKKLDRVVIGSCSPRMHEQTFRHTVEEAGLNPAMLEIANLREHVSWVTQDPDEATEKAMTLVNMCLAKVLKNEPLYMQELPITKRSLVIGGGISGIQAALDIADAGYEVVLVEKDPSIGGHMARLDKTFPTLDCSICILAPKMVDVANHPKIKLYTYSEVEKVSGFVGNFDVTIRKKARSVNIKKCRSCGDCYQKCPVKLPNEVDNGMSQRRAIYTPLPQSVPNAPVIDRDNCRYFTKGKCKLCEKICNANAIDYDQEDEIITERFGSIVVATGYELSDPSAYQEYGVGRYKDIITGLDFDRIANASGPTKGKIVRPSDGTEPKKIVFIQCVGSRDETKGKPYCSSFCCMYTAKHAILFKDNIPDGNVTVFYTDLRAAYKNYDEFIRRAREDYGVKYIRGRVSKIFEEKGKLIVKGSDTLLGSQVNIEADMVVLATAAVPRKEAKSLARKIGISTDKFGFYTEAHPKLRPVEVLSAGVYIAGSCVSPKDIPECVSMASGTAAKISGLFSKSKLYSEINIAGVNPQLCVSCFACKEVCPYEAISEEEYNSMLVASVNKATCKGCGGCASSCRTGAMQLKGFTDLQLSEVIEAYGE